MYPIGLFLNQKDNSDLLQFKSYFCILANISLAYNIYLPK